MAAGVDDKGEGWWEPVAAGVSPMVAGAGDWTLGTFLPAVFQARQRVLLENLDPPTY